MFTKIDHMLIYNRTSSTLQRIEIITIIGHNGIKLEISNNKVFRKIKYIWKLNSVPLKSVVQRRNHTGN